MTKAEEILEKHLKNNLDQRLYLRSSRLTYNLCLDALNEAINYTQCCEKLKDEKDDDDWVQRVIDRDAISAQWRKENL